MQRDDEWNPSENPYATPRSLAYESKPGAGAEHSEQELKPFRTIWTRPRETVRRIIAVNPELHVVLLACLAGIGETLDRASMRNLGDKMPLAAILGVALVFGPLGGLLSLWVGSHLIRLSGNWMGGAGNRESIKTAIAWASVPAVFALPLWIPAIAFFGSDMFTAATPRLDAQPVLWIPFVAIALVEIVLGVWGFVLLCNTIAEVQGFHSAWAGLGNLILAGALFFVPLLVIVFGVVFLLQA
ncbi:Yip1 family protein [Lignipirellula cremea]|uniref:Yip1 domain protein n=1 Tax=Lignipirellula cremea TaxID=2528010 RepID=A0A518DRA5_9BACT|nr:Yip1 family protein [Lignipirellula cremea]QDU94367.1 Yip1 domain protein [Lignipirellula cremea]